MLFRSAFGRFDGVVLAITGATLATWVADPDLAVLPWASLAAGAAALARLARWRGMATLREPLLWVLHLGYAWVAIGFILLAGVVPGLPASGALHALTGGAVGTMILAVMTRASLGHTGRRLAAGPVTTTIYLLVTLAAVLRVVAPLAGDLYTWVAILTAGGAAWSGAFGVDVGAQQGQALLLRGAPEVGAWYGPPARGFSRYALSRPDGLYVGATARRSWATTPDAHAARWLRGAARTLVPGSDGAEVAAHLVGLRPVTPDGIPLVGPHPTLPGVLVAAGHGRHGSLLAPVTAARVLALAERAEALGFDSIWVGDSVTARPRHDPLTLLAAVAARTRKPELGTAVLLPALRNPVLLAHQVGEYYLDLKDERVESALAITT